ncbi:enoyl-CoA hydratase/isomerase family protein [Pseudobacillus badius]|uniref:enoyl-CoA hydratase/isomerase family protein n=1 Tax=Bacillus badius TaxID=1455 RepID=UPI0007B0A153|nr:enoyl-CoA hydratase-related protein [Bacillus badius]KZN99585.1 enoyl-CoA hydratase [Bacillus badius]OCS85689.1 enoyl-CoA hydratase [Bacillus badius]OVE51957.1 enoyl-CoA hydratase [Bacillus badius]TDW03393.1 short chain enoyl-CoA hydratase [Bacillus badius]
MNLQTMKAQYLDSGVCLLTIDNPPANTLSLELQQDLYEVVDTLGKDPDVRVIVFASAHPKIFIAGANLNNVNGDGTKPVDYDEGCRQMQEAFNRLEQIPKPTVAVINGHALGGGCEFVLACDFRLMSDTGTIGLTELSLGLIPAAGGTQRLTRLLGKAKATEMILLGKRLKAEEAERIGLVHQVTSAEALLEEALAFADKLANGAVQAMGLAKACIYAAAEEPLASGLKIEREAFAKTFTTGEPDEGLAAFFEKRRPDFINTRIANS